MFDSKNMWKVQNRKQNKNTGKVTVRRGLEQIQDWLTMICTSFQRALEMLLEYPNFHVPMSKTWVNHGTGTSKVVP